MRFLSIITIVFVALLSSSGTALGQTTVSCDSYTFQEAAQFILNESNAEALDPDGDGIACEELPGSDSPSSDDDDSEPELSTDLTEQEEQYFDAIIEDSNTFGTAMKDVSELFGQASVDPTLLFDQEWIVDLAVQFVTMRQIGEHAQTLQPSARQQHIHALWLEVNRMMGLAMDDITRGIDNLDVDAITLGSNRLLYANNLVNDTTAAVLAFQDNPNVPVEPASIIGPVADCEPFASFAIAQEYYGAHPEEQGTIDPNVDGRACEVFFGQ